MSKSLGLLAALAATSLLFALSAGQALGATVHCGDVITQDTTLDSDLNCPGDGLTIDADNVTLDLNGHAIHGSGQFAGVNGRSGDPTLVGIEVKNGTVTGFGTGLNLTHIEGLVTDMVLSGNHDGLDGYKGSLVVENSVVADNSGRGIDVVRSGGFTLTNSQIRDNAGLGLALDDVHCCGAVAHNSITGNGKGSPYVPAGIALGFTSLPITENVISDNRGDGIIGGYSGSPITDNVISGNGDNGIHWVAGSVTANRNEIRGNAANGVLGDDGGEAPPSGHLEANTISENGQDGIHIGANDGRGCRCSTLTENSVDRNGHDGIELNNADGLLTGNHTWFNGNLGIEAVPGTLGGGNWAKHNGNPLQCVPGSLCSTTGKPKG